MRASFCSMSGATVASFVLSSACTAQVPVETTAGAVDCEHPCQADKAEPLVGRIATPETLAKTLQLSNSAIIRIVKPGQPISMDYMTNRLTVEVDERNRIVRLYCG